MYSRLESIIIIINALYFDVVTMLPKGDLKLAIISTFIRRTLDVFKNNS